MSERAKGPSHQAGEVLIVHCTAHSIELTFHALCDTVAATAFGFLVVAASDPADQEQVWQRYRLQHHLFAVLKRKEDARMARPHHTLGTVSLHTCEPLSPTCLMCGKAAHIAYHTQRMVITLSGHHRLHLAVRRRTFPECPRSHRPYRPEAEGAWALPHGEYG